MPSKEFSNLASGVLFLCTIAFCVVFFVAWDLYKKRHIFKFSRKLNGYTFYPIIGHGYHIFGYSVFRSLCKASEIFNFPMNLWAGHSYNYVTTDAAEIKVILNHSDTFDKHSSYRNFDILIKDSISVAKFDRWKTNRKLFARCFSQPMLQSFIDIFHERSNVLVKRLKECGSENLFEVFEKISIETFYRSLMGLDWNKVISDTDFPDCFSRVQKFLENRIVTSYYYPDFVAFLTPKGKDALKAIKRIKEIINEVLEEKRKAIIDKEVEHDRRLFVDIMLDGGFNEDEIYHEITLFMGAATDTSGATMAFTFTLLGMNPQIQEKVYTEVEKIIGKSGAISYDDLSNLKYTERVIRETMRLFPIVPILARHSTADVDLGTRIIPAGCDIILSVFHLHRSETHWPNPLEFDPDRFLPEEVAKRHPYSYIPFSGGSRNCIGMKYALLMMKMFVANVIRNYHITSNYRSVEEMELNSSMTMKTTHALDCKFTPRIQ